MRCVLTLFEGVATGAADGYFRLKQAPATTLLHLSPAWPTACPTCTTPRRLDQALSTSVGERADFHLKHDAPLSGDIEGVARPMSHWVRTVQSSAAVAHDAADALAVARGTPHCIATLILPADASWEQATEVACAADAIAPQAADAPALQTATALCVPAAARPCSWAAPRCEASARLGGPHRRPDRLQAAVRGPECAPPARCRAG